MSTARFRVFKHTTPASHIREYPRAIAGLQEDELHLAVKQYVPLDASSADDGDVTIIGAHANGFAKELYEPLWDDLYDRLKAKGIRIRSIWIADVANQGESGVLNEENLASWMDHSRDLFLMVNRFRKHMQRPLIGIGHSMGGCHLVNLALMHPRLLTSLVLIDPVIQRAPSSHLEASPAHASVKRRDRWPDRSAAGSAFKRNKFYQAWDPRVLDKWIEYGLRDLPTLLHPELIGSSSSEILPTVSADHTVATTHPVKEVTLTTTKHQEVATFLRGNFPTQEFPAPSADPNPLTHPDVKPDADLVGEFYRPEPMLTFGKLPNLRPSVLYLFGSLSNLSSPVLQADKLANTGVGVGGSGGTLKGRVSSVVFDGVGHLIPMEVVGATADASAAWIVPEIARWRAVEKAERAEWVAVPHRQKGQLSEEYIGRMTGSWMDEAIEAQVGEKSKL